MHPAFPTARPPTRRSNHESTDAQTGVDPTRQRGGQTPTGRQTGRQTHMVAAVSCRILSWAPQSEAHRERDTHTDTDAHRHRCTQTQMHTDTDAHKQTHLCVQLCNCRLVHEDRRNRPSSKTNEQTTRRATRKVRVVAWCVRESVSETLQDQTAKEKHTWHRC